MTDKEIKRLHQMGYDKFHTPLVCLIGVTYNLFNPDNRGDVSIDNYNDMFAGIIHKHKPNFVFYDEKTKRVYSMAIHHIIVDNMVPCGNLSILKQADYDINAYIDMRICDKSETSKTLCSWYNLKRRKFNEYQGDIFNTLIGMEVADDIAIGDYCAFLNIVQALTIVEEFVLEALLRNSTCVHLSVNGNSTRYFSKAEIFWASMITNVVVEQIAHGFLDYDTARNNYRFTKIELCIDYHTRKLLTDELQQFTEEVDDLVAIDDIHKYSFKYLSVGVLVVSDNIMY